MGWAGEDLYFLQCVECCAIVSPEFLNKVNIGNALKLSKVHGGESARDILEEGQTLSEA